MALQIDRYITHEMSYYKLCGSDHKTDHKNNMVYFHTNLNTLNLMQNYFINEGE